MMHIYRISYFQGFAKMARATMNPCKTCIKGYNTSPCTSLKHCAFEGTTEKPFSEGQVQRHSGKLLSSQVVLDD